MLDENAYYDSFMELGNTLKEGRTDAVTAGKVRALMERMADTVGNESRSAGRIPRPDMGGHSGRSQERLLFESFGHQIKAIADAGRVGGVADPRLFQVRAATGMSESIAADGGFLLEDFYAKEVLTKAQILAKLAPLCRKITIGPNSNSVKINAIAESSRVSSTWGGIISYWLNEAGTKTASAPKFRQMELNLNKLIGLCYATDELLQDASTLESVLKQGFSENFAATIDRAIIRGSGVGQPLGVLNSPCLVSVTRSAANTIASADVINMWSRFNPSSFNTAVWLISASSIPQLLSMSMLVGTTGGSLTFMPPSGLSQSPYGTLFGRPVIPMEACSVLGEVGDIILADPNSYILADKGSTQFSSSIHVAFLTDQSIFRWVYRIAGQPTWEATLTPERGSSVSPFVVLSA